MDARVWLGPDRPPELVEAIERGGGSLVALEEANAIVWASRDHGGVEAIAEMRRALHPGVGWVQVDSAGIETWLDSGLVNGDRVWTGAQASYAVMCAEHAVALVLAACKRLPQHARACAWSELHGERLEGRTVGIVGAGGIGRETIARLAPFGVEIVALTGSGREVTGASRSLGPDGLDELLAASDFVVLAAPLTPRTRRLIGVRELDRIGPSGWLVNVSRGALVDTDALVEALRAGRLGGACLDVTDPEPLPDDHPLWTFPNVLVTPHVANTWAVLYASLAERVRANVERFAAGRALEGRIDAERGY